MIDEIFACPVRKYNISDDEISKWANSLYDKQKFNMPSPFKLNFTNMEAWITQQYTDILEEFVKGIGAFFLGLLGWLLVTPGSSGRTPYH